LIRSTLAVVLGILAAIYFARQLVSYWPNIVAISFTTRVATSVAVAALLHVFSGLIDAWAWGWLLRGLSVPVRSRDAMAVFLVSQFAKYVPGSIGQHVGRLALAKTRGLPYPTVLLSLVVENGFALGAGGVVAGASLAFGVAVSAGSAARLSWTLALVILGWFVGAMVLRTILAYPPFWLRRLLKLEKPVTLQTHLVAGYFVVHVTSYAAIGGALVLVVFGFTGGAGIEVWRVALAGMAGGFSGYIVPGAPAGLGVREATLTAMLGPICGTAVALSSALLWRASALLADGILFLIGLGLRVRVRASEP
jgi:uncharacterized membrane protein YbhN (UPF0104 family)